MSEEKKVNQPKETNAKVKEVKTVINKEPVKRETKLKDHINSAEYIAKLNIDLEDQTKKAEEYLDSLKRNMAEFDNFKKRIMKEKESLYTMIIADVIARLLPTVDNFTTALSHECKDNEFKSGIEMIYNQIIEVFNSFGIEKIDDVGFEFNPEYHEAVMHVDDSKKGEKEIIECMRTGYKMKDKVIRHSMVKVAN